MARSEPDNIQAFNYLTLAIFNELYESFPERVDIKGLHFVVKVVAQSGPDAPESRHVQLLPDTMAWLQEEGFIKWHGATLGGDYQQVTLTLKGLTVLGYLPTSVDGSAQKETIIERARRVLAQGAEGAAADAVKGVVASALALSVQVLG